jgi:hypothetical protein
MQWREGVAKLNNAIDVGIITQTDEIPTEVFVEMQRIADEANKLFEQIRGGTEKRKKKNQKSSTGPQV